jgi:hypothetical protein
MSPVLLVVLVILAIAFLGSGVGFHTGYWGGSPNYGYSYGSGGLGLVLLIVVLFLVFR